MTKPKLLRTYQNLIEAEGARAYLEAHGVPTEIPDRHSLTQQPHLIGVFGGVRLRVPEDQFEHAESLLAEIEKRSHLQSVDEHHDPGLYQDQRRQNAIRWLARLIATGVVLYWLMNYFGFHF